MDDTSPDVNTHPNDASVGTPPAAVRIVNTVPPAASATGGKTAVGEGRRNTVNRSAFWVRSAPLVHSSATATSAPAASAATTLVASADDSVQITLLLALTADVRTNSPVAAVNTHTASPRSTPLPLSRRLSVKDRGGAPFVPAITNRVGRSVASTGGEARRSTAAPALTAASPAMIAPSMATRTDTATSSLSSLPSPMSRAGGTTQRRVVPSLASVAAGCTAGSAAAPMMHVTRPEAAGGRWRPTRLITAPPRASTIPGTARSTTGRGCTVSSTSPTDASRSAEGSASAMRYSPEGRANDGHTMASAATRTPGTVTVPSSAPSSVDVGLAGMKRHCQSGATGRSAPRMLTSHAPPSHTSDGDTRHTCHAGASTTGRAYGSALVPSRVTDNRVVAADATALPAGTAASHASTVSLISTAGNTTGGAGDGERYSRQAGPAGESAGLAGKGHAGSWPAAAADAAASPPLVVAL